MRQKKTKKHSGFTLIELLVVIAIVAILAIVVVLVLNPAQLLKQARDSNRISDLATVKSAISYYLQDQTSPSMGTAGTCYEDGEFLTGTQTVSTTTCPWYVTATTLNSSSSRAVTGAGWIPINLTNISVGAPIGTWPVDPVNTIGQTGAASDTNDWFYTYEATTTNFGFKVAANMESTKYSSGGTADVESTDGGTNAQEFEQGSALSL